MEQVARERGGEGEEWQEVEPGVADAAADDLTTLPAQGGRRHCWAETPYNHIDTDHI